MAHLSAQELADFLEGTLAGTRGAHLDGCEECRLQAEELRSVWIEARQAEVPEPSPLFWDHFSARVREAMLTEPAPAPPHWWTAWPPSRLATAVTAATMVVAVIVGGRLLKGPSSEPATSNNVVAAVPATRAEPEVILGPLDDSAEWTFVLTVTEELGWDEVSDAGLAVLPGAAEQAVFQLLPDERHELARLLKVELARPKL